MSRTTCPVTFVILHPTNKSPVRTIECQAVVHVRRERQWPHKAYYFLPMGNKYHLRVHLEDGRRGRFVARIDERNLPLIIFPSTTKEM